MISMSNPGRRAVAPVVLRHHALSFQWRFLALARVDHMRARRGGRRYFLDLRSELSEAF